MCNGLQDGEQRREADQVEEIEKLKVLRSTECSQLLSKSTQK